MFYRLKIFPYYFYSSETWDGLGYSDTGDVYVGLNWFEMTGITTGGYWWIIFRSGYSDLGSGWGVSELKKAVKSSQ